ncbi:MAG: ABC transporter ATP-binding protein [Planctomycetota bacterium]|nr:ABC transporter ATP-binding protein [Planctomycetota bacterium]
MAVPTPRPLAVEVRGLRRNYSTGFLGRPREVLHGLELEIGRGEFIGLVGPNGSGKSTLLRLLAGVDEVEQGSIRVFGHAPDSQAARRATGFCPEDSPFPSDLAARDVLALLGSLHGLGGAELERRANELLVRVGLAESARTKLGAYSRGMLRRFGIAASLLHQPELVLLDEPTAGLDAPGYAAIDGLLDEVRARGATLVVSSHLLGELHQRCDRIVVLVEGRIVASGSSEELVRTLGASARLELAVEGLDANGLAELRRVAEQRGGRVVAVQPSQAVLVELYRRAATGKTPGETP